MLAYLQEVFESSDGNKFLNEELRVEDGDVRRPTNEVIGGAREDVEHVVADEVDVGLIHDWLKDVVHHLDVDGTYQAESQTFPVNFYISPITAAVEILSTVIYHIASPTVVTHTSVSIVSVVHLV